MKVTPEWMALANCRGLDPDVMFPSSGSKDDVDESVNDAVLAAKAVCAGCSVREECLEHALVNREEYGVWGGASERERRRMRRSRRQGSAA